MGSEKVEKRVSIISYGLLVMAVTHTLTHVFQRIHTAIFPIIRTEFDLSLQQLGLIAAIPSLCQAILSIPMGLLSDRFGSRKMIAINLLIALVGGIVASRATNPVMLTLAISLIYINTTIYHPAAYSFTTRLFKPNDRPKALGIHSAGGTLGMALGPISVSILMGGLAFGWRQVYLFWIVPLLLGIIAVLLMRSEPTEDAMDDSPAETDPPGESMFTLSLVLFLIFLAVRMVGGQMIGAFLPIYLVDEKGLNAALSSLVYGSSSLMGLVAAPLGGLLASKFGEKRWLFIALSLSYASLVLAIVVPNVFAFVAFYLSYAFCGTLGMAANSSIMARLTPSRRRGLGYGLFFLPGGIMGAVAPLIAANIAETSGLGSIFIIALAFYAVGLAVLKLGVDV